MTELSRTGEVFVLDLGEGENRFHPDWMTGISDALDEVVAADGAKALVTTATGKIWSNGLDLDWLSEHGEEFLDYSAAVHELLASFLELPVPTVAAIQGHAFAAGAMLALAHDQRVMRADRGWFCLPEVDIRIPFTPGMAALITSRLQPQVAQVAMTTGHRYGGEEALEAAIVDAAVPGESVLPAALELAASLAGKASDTLGTIKQRIHAPVLAALRAEPMPFSGQP